MQRNNQANFVAIAIFYLSGWLSWKAWQRLRDKGHSRLEACFYVGGFWVLLIYFLKRVAFHG